MFREYEKRATSGVLTTTGTTPRPEAPIATLASQTQVTAELITTRLAALVEMLDGTTKPAKPPIEHLPESLPIATSLHNTLTILDSADRLIDAIRGRLFN